MLRRAGVTIMALVIGNLAGVMMLPAAPAMAGGWAATVIDPGGAVEAGKAHRVSFWVLQHGTHPFNWSEPASLGAVGLTLTDDGGKRVTFTGQQLPEPAHYVTTITVPNAGRWKVTAIQGIFAGFHVGSLNVPGTFEPLGVPAAPSTQDMQKYWPGAVRPPVLPIDQNREPFVRDVPALEVPNVEVPAVAETVGTPATRPDTRPWVLAGALLVSLAALALGARRWWSRRGVAEVSR